MKTSDKILVSVVMGSDSDFGIMEESTKVLKDFQIPYEDRPLPKMRRNGVSR